MWSLLKRWIQSTLGFTGREANAMLILLPTLLLVVFSEPLYRLISYDNQPISFRKIAFLDSLGESIPKKEELTEQHSSRFNFNPNTASKTEFDSLGVSDRIAERIIKYRTSGGVFRIKSDLAKIYGFDSILYQSLEPFILLPEKLESKPFVSEKKDVLKEKRKIEYNLNLADTSDLKSVNGIGTILAGRILKYRDALGGFINKSQLKEVYGLDTAVISRMSQFIVAENFVPSRININTASESELDKHPYLSSREAKAIITYRMQHGGFSSVADLKQIKSINEKTLTKISPYLRFSNE